MPGVSDAFFESVASTKLLPPRGARRLIPRDALLARLQEVRRHRCVVLQGPAGCGKTSTLIAWRQALLALEFDVAWLSLVPEDDDLARFFDCLLASLAEVDAAMLRETSLLMGRDSDDAAVEHWVIVFVQAIALRQRELVLMLDDVQNLQEPRIFRALQWLLDYAPVNLHLALSSRSALPLSLARLRGQGLLAEFDLRDMRFSLEESERYLREQLGDIDARDVRMLHELTDGWAAGLQLFAVDLKSRQGAAYARVELRDARAFAGYFEEEVLLRLAPTDLDTLKRAATCHRFCAPLCAALLGRADAVGGLADDLARLERDNMFILQVGSHDHENWYRLHPLLREVLLARIAREPEHAQRALHRAAWHWFEAHGKMDEAVRHALSAGEAEAAAGLVESLAQRLLSRSELTPLASLMRRLPQEQLESHFGLRLAQASLQLYALNLDALRLNLDRMEWDFGELDTSQRAGITVLRAGLALQCDDTAAVRAILPQLEAVPHDAEPYLRAGCSHVLAWMYLYEGEGGRARAILDDSERRGNVLGRGLVARSLRGLSYSVQGQMVEAEAVLREALHTAERHAGVELGVVCVAAGLLADVLYEFNELDAVCKLLEPRIELLERASIPDAVLRALLALAGAHKLQGRRLEASACLDRLEDHAVRNGLDRLLANALAVRLRWHLLQAETTQADVVLERLFALDARHARGASVAAMEIRRIAARARIDLSLHWNDFDTAIESLKPLLADVEGAGRARQGVHVRLQLASAEHGRGHTEMAHRHLIEALHLAHRLGLVRTVLDAAPRVPIMLESLLHEEGLNPVLAFHVRRLLDARAQTRSLAKSEVAGRNAAAAAAAQALSERELEVLRLVAQAMPNKKIARVLGLAPATVKWHLRNVYVKLGVTERDEAVARLRDIESA